MNILEDTNPGGRLGSALGIGLERLAHSKLQQLQQRSFKDAATKAGIAENVAKFWSLLPEKTQAALLQDFSQSGGFAGAMPSAAEAYSAPISAAIGQQALPPGLQALISGEQPNQMQDMGGGQANIAAILDAIRRPGMPEAQQFAPGLQQLLNSQQQDRALPELKLPQAVQAAAQQQPRPAQPQAPKIGMPQPVAAPLPQQLTPEQERFRKFQEAAAQKKGKFAEAQQKRIDMQNKPYNVQLDKAVTNAQEIKNLATELKEIIESGNAASGWSGLVPQITGGLGASDQTQRFVGKAKELALRLSSQGGTGTNLRVKAAEETKPKLSDAPEAQLAKANDIIRAANRVLVKENLRQQLIEENGGRQPENIGSLIEKRFKQIPDVPSDAVDGDVYEDNKGGMWVIEDGIPTKIR